MIFAHVLSLKVCRWGKKENKYKKRLYSRLKTFSYNFNNILFGFKVLLGGGQKTCRI